MSDNEITKLPPFGKFLAQDWGAVSYDIALDGIRIDPGPDGQRWLIITKNHERVFARPCWRQRSRSQIAKLLTAPPC